MAYEPVKKSNSGRGDLVPKPSSEDIRSEVLEDDDRKFFVIEWQDTDAESWFVARGRSFVELEDMR